MKQVMVAILFALIHVPMAWSEVNPSHETVICSGMADSQTYFTLSRQPREDKEELFVFDIETPWSNDSAPLYVSDITTTDGAVTYLFKLDSGSAADPMELEINLESGNALFKNYDDHAIELVCKSSAKPVDDMLEFIEVNGLPVFVE